jgi:transposase-like protein
MAKLKTVEELFKGRHFDRDVVILCVRWYLRFGGSSGNSTLVAIQHRSIRRCATMSAATQ